MRVFLCPYDGFSLAIPMDSVLSVILNFKEYEEAFELNPENQNIYISLPVLLNCAGKELRHGIILKDGNDEKLENKTVLLTYEIECEIELAQNKIYPLPGFLSAVKYSGVFLGFVFSNIHQMEKASGRFDSQELVLLLNTDFIIQNAKKELKT